MPKEIKWTKVTDDNFIPETEVLAINIQNEALTGYLHFSENVTICENDSEVLFDVAYWITIKDLLKTLPDG